MRILGDIEEDSYGATIKLWFDKDEIEILRIATGYFNIEDAVIQILEEAVEEELNGES